MVGQRRQELAPRRGNFDLGKGRDRAPAVVAVAPPLARHVGDLAALIVRAGADRHRVAGALRRKANVVLARRLAERAVVAVLAEAIVAEKGGRGVDARPLPELEVLAVFGVVVHVKVVFRRLVGPERGGPVVAHVVGAVVGALVLARHVEVERLHPK